MGQNRGLIKKIDEEIQRLYRLVESSQKHYELINSINAANLWIQESTNIATSHMLFLPHKLFYYGEFFRETINLFETLLKENLDSLTSSSINR